ncbi:DUF1776 domain-containing protein [Candidatus Bathyarchaeota archaeon]|nr:DUF1776 domain-containing protein [Candidatus Bathyarchaeota archaeon]
MPNQIWRYSGDLAEVVDGKIESAAVAVRSTLSSSPWLPDSFRPSPPPPNPILIVGASRFEIVQGWIVRNRVVLGVGAAVLGLVSYRVYRTARNHRKSRKARRSRRNGGRVEVVVIAGSPDLPLTKSLALDMERKGFMVYIVCGGPEDEACVQNFSRPDIRSLTIDVTNVSVKFYAPWPPVAALHDLTVLLASFRHPRHRALRRLPQIALYPRPEGATRPPLPQSHHAHPGPQLPDLAHSHHTTQQLRRRLQHPHPPPHRHHPGLPPPPHRPPRPRGREEHAAKGDGLHPVHHILHQPALPRPGSHRLLRPDGLHRGADGGAPPPLHPRHAHAARHL